MVECRFFDEGDRVIFKAMGHCLYAPKGQDIVCAGISALLQAAEIGCCNFSASTEVDKADGRLDICAEANQATRAILWTTKTAVKKIAEQYPECVKVR